LSQNELAAIVQVAPITVVRHVERLEALGLVERCGDPEDRRVWRLQLTPAAAPVLRAGKHSRTTPDELIVKGVDSAALRAMVVGLARMRENLVSGGPGTTHRTRRVKISRWKIGRRSLCPQAVRHV
jgi:MarR family transcriptional regulator for hemolysin